jgi:Transport and Golgi organisation 2
MCTVSFIPNTHGYFLGMNRDESRLRPIALKPEVRGTGEGFAIYPSEPSGGTWIGMNDSGLCLALVNWYRVPTLPLRRITSRGIIVKEMIQLRTGEDLAGFLLEMPLEQMPPFRLIAISPPQMRVREFRWDQARVTQLCHRWAARHWFSSGLDEQQAEVTRAEVCRRAWNEPDAGELGWLRRLHRSHLPERGGLSLCMHREEACTVSYTEVEFSDARAAMRYHPGPLCSCDSQFFEKTLSIVTEPIAAKGMESSHECLGSWDFRATRGDKRCAPSQDRTETSRA